jgi:hypothetical protein
MIIYELSALRVAQKITFTIYSNPYSLGKFWQLNI